MRTNKSWKNSKTIWFNIITLVLTILGLFNQDVMVVLGFSNPTYYLTIQTMIVAVLNILLRMITDTRITTNGK